MRQSGSPHGVVDGRVGRRGELRGFETLPGSPGQHARLLEDHFQRLALHAGYRVPGVGPLKDGTRSTPVLPAGGPPGPARAGGAADRQSGPLGRRPHVAG